MLLIQLWIKNGFALQKKLGMGGFREKVKLLMAFKLLNPKVDENFLVFLNARVSINTYYQNSKTTKVPKTITI